MKNNDYTGICVIVGGQNVNRHYIMTVLKDRFPFAKIIENPDYALFDLLNCIDTIVYNHVRTHKHYIISTNNPIILRAIECYCDYYDVMKSLNVYDIENYSSDIDAVPNITYMDIGLTKVYNRYNNILNQLNDLITRHD